MKVILVATSSLNGQIARFDGLTNWKSDEDHQWFRSFMQSIGVIIVGKNTFDAVAKRGSLLDVKLRAVVTHEKNLVPPNPQTIFTDAPPREILKMIKDRGFDTAVVAGGAEIYTLFLKENLVDELYLTIEPIVLGQGIPLFANAIFESRLKLLDTKKLNNDTLRLHYGVVK